MTSFYVGYKSLKIFKTNKSLTKTDLIKYFQNKFK